MGFISQYEKTRLGGRRRMKSSVAVSQSYKPSTGSQEMSFRVSSVLMDRAGISLGDRVDVLRDKNSDLWMIKKMAGDGFSVTGKDGGPSLLIRYTLKELHDCLSDDEERLKKYGPVRFECDEDSVVCESGEIVFSLKSQ